MLTIDSIASLRKIVGHWRAQGESVGFVPTMGNLHEGHLKLVEEAKKHTDRVVVSIFVNPLQFGPKEDFSAYPRTPSEDASMLGVCGVDVLYLPDTNEIYPEGLEGSVYVEVPNVSDELCGFFRPGHFRGVATIVCKLLNQVEPDLAVFGQKDYQQLMVIKRMVSGLNMPVKIMSVPTVRELDGLAKSSRNVYLSEDERPNAAMIFKSLNLAADSLNSGSRDFDLIVEEQTTFLTGLGFRVDYFSIRNPDNLQLSHESERRFVILVAAHLGRARLIDNLCCPSG
jgi:pantoate--beta-alanine ligase